MSAGRQGTSPRADGGTDLVAEMGQVVVRNPGSEETNYNALILHGPCQAGILLSKSTSGKRKHSARLKKGTIAGFVVDME
jgi:hypothetical protein